MISPYKLSATQGIFDFRLLILDCRPKEATAIEKSKLENQKYPGSLMVFF
jgi:hypothetical protein